MPPFMKVIWGAFCGFAGTSFIWLGQSMPLTEPMGNGIFYVAGAVMWLFGMVIMLTVKA